jgi:hypothetical protein
VSGLAKLIMVRFSWRRQLRNRSHVESSKQGKHAYNALNGLELIMSHSPEALISVLGQISNSLTVVYQRRQETSLPKSFFPFVGAWLTQSPC